MDEPIKLNAVILRSVADDAASWREPFSDPGYMVTTYTAGQGWSTIFTTDPVLPGDDRVVTPVNTAVLAPQRPPVESVTIRAKGMEDPIQLVPRYDAVFWSESAVEKFVFPYYASKGQWMAATVLTALTKLFYGMVPGSPPATTTGSGEEEVPFALAHLPRSDYVGLPEFAPIGVDLHVLFVKDGQVAHRPFSEYL